MYNYKQVNAKKKRNIVLLEYIIKEGDLDWCVRKALLQEGIHELILVGQASIIKEKSQWKNFPVKEDERYKDPMAEGKKI